jgi:hypothetical protein
MNQQERTEQLNKALEDLKLRFGKGMTTQVQVIVPARLVLNDFKTQIERMSYDRRNA